MWGYKGRGQHASSHSLLSWLGIHTHTLPRMPDRVKIFPGVTSAQLCQVLRTNLQMHKIDDIGKGWGDLCHLHPKLAPRVGLMAKYADMALGFVRVAKNGVVGHASLKVALEDLYKLSGQGGTIKQQIATILELSQGIRTLLGWFREVGKGKATEKILKGASPAQRQAIQVVVDHLVMCEDEMKSEIGEDDGPIAELNSGGYLWMFFRLTLGSLWGFKKLAQHH